MCRFVGWLQNAALPGVPGSGYKTAEEAAVSLPDPAPPAIKPEDLRVVIQDLLQLSADLFRRFPADPDPAFLPQDAPVQRVLPRTAAGVPAQRACPPGTPAARCVRNRS